jgi:hypothetical protein
MSSSSSKYCSCRRAARSGAEGTLTAVAPPFLPVVRSPLARLERQQVQLAVQQVEQLLGVRVDVRPHIEPGRHDDLEARRDTRVAAGDLEGDLLRTGHQTPPPTGGTMSPSATVAPFVDSSAWGRAAVRPNLICSSTKCMRTAASAEVTDPHSLGHPGSPPRGCGLSWRSPTAMLIPFACRARPRR